MTEIPVYLRLIAGRNGLSTDRSEKAGDFLRSAFHFIYSLMEISIVAAGILLGSASAYAAPREPGSTIDYVELAINWNNYLNRTVAIKGVFRCDNEDYCVFAHAWEVRKFIEIDIVMLPSADKMRLVVNCRDGCNVVIFGRAALDHVLAERVVFDDEEPKSTIDFAELMINWEQYVHRIVAIKGVFRCGSEYYCVFSHAPEVSDYIDFDIVGLPPADRMRVILDCHGGCDVIMFGRAIPGRAGPNRVLVERLVFDEEAINRRRREGAYPVRPLGSSCEAGSLVTAASPRLNQGDVIGDRAHATARNILSPSRGAK